MFVFVFFAEKNKTTKCWVLENPNFTKITEEDKLAIRNVTNHRDKNDYILVETKLLHTFKLLN